MRDTLTIQNIADVREEMRNHDYVERAPQSEGDQLDAQIAQDTRCPIDDLPRSYVGFKAEGRRGYRAFAVCTNNHAEEF